jgi:HEAT repeat protein
MPLLIGGLSSENGAVRRKSRESLVTLGQSAVPALIKALGDPNDQVRWEAAKALCCLRAPEAAEPLVNALGDEIAGTRWLAGEALMALGRAALEPLLAALTKPAGTDRIGRGAHRILRELVKTRSCELVRPVLTALEQSEPAVAVPVAAEIALMVLRDRAGSR